jgi:hypothetical protein
VPVGIENSSSLDLVTISKSGEEVALIMVAAEPWTEAKVLALQAKTQSYLTYVESGGLARDYPASVGKRLRFQLDTTHPLSELAQRFVSVASTEWCNPVGIRFVVSSV